jgi:hypothetical protein
MKEEFKKWLALHKGKILDEKMITMISNQHETEVYALLYNEGFVLESVDDGRFIQAGGDEKDWSVHNSWSIPAEREFMTLKGAIKYIGRGNA